MSAFLLLLACGGQTGGRWAEGDAERPPPAPYVAPAPASVVVPREVVVGNAEAVGIELQFEGVGPLFQGFFADPELVGRLGVDLASCTRGDRAVVRVSWSEETRIGRITVEADGATLGCRPVDDGGGADLAPLTPLGQALARYRDGVSGRFDVRIASFRTGLRVLQGMNHCALWLGGQYPPDGTSWSRCVEFAGNETCMAGDRRDGVTRMTFAGASAEMLRACFAE